MFDGIWMSINISMGYYWWKEAVEGRSYIYISYFIISGRMIEYDRINISFTLW
jgi:hypothetical protein